MDIAYQCVCNIIVGTPRVLHSWEGVKDQVSVIRRKTVVYNKELFPQSTGIWGEREEVGGGGEGN